MYTLLSVISLMFLLGLYINYYINKHKKNKKKFQNTINIINNIHKSITKEIYERKGDNYYDNLKASYETIEYKISNIPNKYSKNNLIYLNNLLCMVDNYNIYLNKKLNQIDEFLYFNKHFNNRKRRYRKMFNKSIKVLNNLNEKYGEYTSTYINMFSEDYDFYKKNYIIFLNKYVKKCVAYVKEYDTKNLNNYFKDIKQIDTNLDIILNEPIRLQDKLSTLENIIEQTETEIKNNKGSLYNKTLNAIKNYKVTHTEVNQWNIIKKKINLYKKNRLMKEDVIKLHQDLIHIIDLMVELCDNMASKTTKESILNDIIQD